MDSDIFLLLIAIFLILFFGKILGSLAKKIKLPEITGELLAGLALGPSLLGKINNHFYHSLFGNEASIFEGLNFLFQLSLIFIMFVSGLKMNLKSIIQEKSSSFIISVFGICIPFLIGLATAKALLFFDFIPVTYDSKYTFTLFLATAFSITALPVIVKLLMDLQIIHTRMGSIIVSAAILADIVGWGVLAFITQSKESPTLSAVFILGSLFIIIKMINEKFLYPFLKNSEKSADALSKAMSLCICLCLFFSALSQMLSLHTAIGGFLAGISLSEILKKVDKLNFMLNQFVSSFFSPLFFVSIGLRVDFIENFNWILVFTIFILASLSKIFAVRIGAFFANIPSKEAMIISIALNARGAMEIVFSAIALNLGIITNPIYVALVIMAVGTSITSGILLRLFYFNQSSLNLFSKKHASDKLAISS